MLTKEKIQDFLFSEGVIDSINCAIVDRKNTCYCTIDFSKVLDDWKCPELSKQLNGDGALITLFGNDRIMRSDYPFESIAQAIINLPDTRCDAVKNVFHYCDVYVSYAGIDLLNKKICINIAFKYNSVEEKKHVA